MVTNAAHPVTEILVLCTANTCRSPMAQALLRRRLAGRGVAALVHSAGIVGRGDPPPREAAAAMAAYGIDTAAHCSRQVSAADLASADLVLAMARLNIRHAVVTLPQVWPRVFTLKELVRRGAAIGPRPPGEAVADWLSRAHRARERGSLLGDCLDDDVPDPVGGPWHGYLDTAVLLDTLVADLVALCWG
jgi:protein-tyrosine phosphatase